MHGKLNPYAKEFVPSSHTTTVASHPKKDITGLNRINAPEIIHDIPPVPTEVGCMGLVPYWPVMSGVQHGWFTYAYANAFVYLILR